MISHACDELHMHERWLKKAKRIEEKWDPEDVPEEVAQLRAHAKTPLAASATLMASFVRTKNEYERMQAYEQRLENTIHRCLRELRLLRKDWELMEGKPRSPFGAQMMFYRQFKKFLDDNKPPGITEDGELSADGELSDDEELSDTGDESRDAAAAEDPSSNLRNKPTAFPAPTVGPAEGCDDQTRAELNPPEATEASP